MSDDASGDILQIERTLPKISIIDGGEGLDEMMGNPLKDKFCVMPVCAYSLIHLINEARIFQHKKMRVEYTGIACPCRLGQADLKLLKFFPCCKQSPLKTSNFRIQFRFWNIPKWNDFLLLKMDQHFPLGDAWRDGRALEYPLSSHR